MASSASKAKIAELDPLRDLLDSVMLRLHALESHVGVRPPAAAKKTVAIAPMSPAPVAKPTMGVPAGEAEAVKAYDKYFRECMVPLEQACDELKGLDNMGGLLREAWQGIRTMIVLASRSKSPPETEYTSAIEAQIAPTSQAVQKIQSLKLDRDWDRHQKAVNELIGCLGWVLLKAPKQLPFQLVKETVGSAEFWTNKIRKDFKGKDDKQIAFCDSVKKALTGLVEYTTEYHKTGLTWNPRGVSLAESVLRLSDEVSNEAPLTPGSKKRRGSALGATVGGGAAANILSELNKRKSEDGSSAATGLKKVSKDQQTWRKEYKKPDGVPTAPSLSQPKKEEKKKKPIGLPICEYQERGSKWVVEHQTKESVLKEFSDGILKVEATDPKQQVYLFNCEGISVQVNGSKVKSVILDRCKKVNFMFDTVISSCEVVNSQKVQLQTTGVCPVFAIDKTTGCTIWLSKESLDVTSFVTSMSTEMNVSYPDGDDDRKELPIPEQFVHKLKDGSVSSEVSDLYH